MQTWTLHILGGPASAADLVFWLVAVAGSYMLPFWLALARSSKLSRKVLLTNLFAGWTVVGWLEAMRMALDLDSSGHHTASLGERARRRSQRRRRAAQALRLEENPS